MKWTRNEMVTKVRVGRIEFVSYAQWDIGDTYGQYLVKGPPPNLGYTALFFRRWEVRLFKA